MRQLLKRIFDGLRGGTPDRLPQTVFVVLERSAPGRALITMGDIDFLSTRLGAMAEARGVGNFEDYEFAHDQVRLTFFTSDAKVLSGVLVAELRQIGWCRGAVVRTTLPETWQERLV